MQHKRNDQTESAPTEIIEGLEDLTADLAALQETLLLIAQSARHLPECVPVVRTEVVH